MWTTHQRLACWLVAAVGLATGVPGQATRADEMAFEDASLVPDIPVYERTRSVPGADQMRFPHETYGRRASPPTGKYAFEDHRSRFSTNPHFSSGDWFQRPYPYHLDYYKMRYGGTYEPYFSGGLYGTPQVVAPAFFGYGYGHPFGAGLRQFHQR